MPVSYANQPTTHLPSISFKSFHLKRKKVQPTQTIIHFTTEKVFQNLFMQSAIAELNINTEK